MGNDPKAPDNQWLRGAYENRIPVIYFLGIAPGRYQAIVPVYVAGWDAKALKARIVFGAQDQQKLVAPQDVQERRYALRTVKQRLHQASFREAVISAYRGRCSLSGLPEKRLLDAAHIIPDANEQLGQPVVPNGLPRPIQKSGVVSVGNGTVGIERFDFQRARGVEASTACFACSEEVRGESWRGIPAGVPAGGHAVGHGAPRPGRRAVNVGERLLRGYPAVRMASRASCGRAA